MLEVQAQAPVRIASSHVNAPGWSVNEGERLAGTFLGLRLAPGNHTVRVSYRPLSFWLAVPVSLLAAIVLTFRKSVE